jgi:hypothetical protein
VDASTSWGIGVLINGQWAAWRIRDNVLQIGSGRDIAWLEALTVEFTVGLLVSQGLRAADILLRSDNQGVIGSFRKGWSHGRFINDSIRCMFPLQHASDISISFLYVESSTNLADPVSRGILLSPDSPQSPGSLPLLGGEY